MDESIRSWGDVEPAREVRVAESMPRGLSEYLDEALQGAGFGIWHLDLVTGLATWNTVASQMLGFGTHIHSSFGLGPVHPDDHDIVRGAVEQCLCDGKAYSLQFRGVRPDGEVRWLHAWAGPPKLVEGQPAYLVGIVVDITSKREADQKLREAEQRHLLVSRAASDVIYEWDLAAGRINWNDAAGEMLGHSVVELSTAALTGEKLHPDDRANVQLGVRQAIADGNSQFATEHRMRRADGSYADVISNMHFVRDEKGHVLRAIGTLHDLTQLKRTDAALRESEGFNRSIVDASTDLINIIDRNGLLTFVNEAGAAALHITDPTGLIGRDWVGLWPISARSSARSAVDMAFTGQIARFTERCHTERGDLRWWDVVVSPICDDEGVTTKLVAVARDITDRKLAAEKLLWNASHDALTGLGNRSSFTDALAQAISCDDDADGVGLLLFDLDDFKQVNDTFGHDAGNAVLTTFARRLEEALDSDATLARLGGDEFAAIIHGRGSAVDLYRVSASVVEAMRAPFVYANRILDCHVTVGGAVFPEHGATPSEVLKSADLALYEAKVTKRGDAVIYTPRLGIEARRRSEMIDLARKAIAEDAIEPFFQPKIRLADGSVQGFEALLRWRGSDGAMQPPADIAAAFEDLDLSAALGEIMLDKIVERMRGWLASHMAFGHVAINAASADFRRDNFAESLLKKLADAGIPANCLQVEVTESVFLGRGAETVGRALTLLDAAGVRIALDDFGTGFASLRHLKQFPVHTVKIDRGFVRDMSTDAGDAAIVAAVLGLGDSLGLEVVAEGVETIEQETRLKELGCDLAQGYLYSQALPASEVERLFQSGRLYASAPRVQRATA